MTPDPGAPRSERVSRRTLIVQGAVLLAVVAALLLGISPAPYVVERPGPVYDTLGTVEVDGEEVPVIEIDGAPSYPTDGRLDLLTVYIDGSRERPIDWFTVIGTAFTPTRELLPIDAVFPEGETDEQSSERSAVAMQNSQQSATAAALRQLDIAYDSVVTVLLVSEGAPADGVLEVDDDILAIDGTPVTDDAQLREIVAGSGLGTELELRIRRGGSERTVTVTTEARSASDPTPIVGIVPGVRFDFPFEVDIHLQKVGGPSAGMMFALGIYDTLTPGALTGGEHIAGTGTIDPEGRVGAIGGVRQKMFGARDAGAEWFLVPQANCGQLGEAPGGLRVVAVSTLAEAVDAVREIGAGGAGESLPGCG